MSAAAVRLDGVTHDYGAVRALDDVALALPEGRLTGLVGPDGVGKSTLMGLVAGARRLQAGRIEALGADMADPRQRRRVCPRIAFMPQGLGGNLYAELSVAENLAFFARLFGQPAGAHEARAATLLEATGLAPFTERPMGKLSGGMKQKLGLCCALIHDPDLLILDEPTTGVDPLSRRQFWDLIGAIRAGAPAMTVLVSTSVMVEAAGFDRLVVMDAGRVVAEGAPAEIVAEGAPAEIVAEGAPAEIAAGGRLEDALRRLRGESAAERRRVVPPRAPTRDVMGDVTGGGAVIVARGLTRRFGDFLAVDGASFSIGRGEIFGFLGSNGCGKSTTMKMLTGLLPASAGEATLFGRPVDARDRAARREIGYMSQSFSLYGELSVRANLGLHARLFDLPRATREARIEGLSARFGLGAHLDARAEDLPLGLRQRLSLAVAVIHRPRVLILDEPTSGVDPAARDAFWRLLIELAREDGVTVFLSTHFMDEAERCDRVALMHAGRVLAIDTPARLIAAEGVATLEEAFVRRLEAERGEAAPVPALPRAAPRTAENGRRAGGARDRIAAYARRETLEVLRDPVRLAFAFLGSAMLMVVFCLGISLDIDELDVAVLDLARDPESRAYVAELEGSRYFVAAEPLADIADGRRRLASGAVSLVVELPPGFGERLKRGDPTEVMAIVDGAIPFKGETVEGYVAGLHEDFLAARARETGEADRPLARIEPRYRYNQDFESIAATAPAMPAILLVMIQAVLTAVSIARERELGSIVNFYVTPTSRLEFLLGKQVSYIAIAYLNFMLLAAMTAFVFGVPLRGDPIALGLGAFFYVWAATSFGLVIATMTSSQVAAVFATSLAAVIPTVQFSGLLQPVSTLDGAARVIGTLWPASRFLHLNVGAFTKGLGWNALAPDVLALACFGPVFTAIAVLALRGQAR